MFPKLSTLNENVEEAIRELSSVGKCKRTRLSDSAGDVYTSLATAEYREGFIMMNVGAKFTKGEKLQGVTYGYLLKVKRGWEPPMADIFYDWCDSATADSAEFARGVLDSGQYDRLFLRGDLWGISGFEFVADFPTQERISALRRLAVDLKRSHNRLAHAALFSVQLVLVLSLQPNRSPRWRSFGRPSPMFYGWASN